MSHYSGNSHHIRVELHIIKLQLHQSLFNLHLFIQQPNPEANKCHIIQGIRTTSELNYTKTDTGSVFVYKRKNYFWLYLAKLRSAFFIIAFSSSSSEIRSSNSFSRFLCSLGVT